jgi:hypothetical protein
LKTWTETFVHELLRQRGLFYYGDGEMLMQEVARHHSYILLDAERLAKVVEEKLAHDAVFKETPQS